MNSLLLKVVSFLVWGVALYEVLQFGQGAEHAGHTHGICGPWGCGPPIAALVGWHGFWLVLAAPLVGALIRSWSVRRLRAVGLLLLACGIIALVGIAIWEAMTWLPRIAAGQPAYFVQRWLFSVVTLTDVPLIPIALAGIALYVSALIKQAVCSPTESSETTPARHVMETHEIRDPLDVLEVRPRGI